MNNMIKTRLLKNAVAVITLLLGTGISRADVVGEWNGIMLATVSADPFNQARFAAITQLAVFEAVNAITGDFQPYLGTSRRRRVPLQTLRRLPLRTTCSAPISLTAQRALMPPGSIRLRR